MGNSGKSERQGIGSHIGGDGGERIQLYGGMNASIPSPIILTFGNGLIVSTVTTVTRYSQILRIILFAEHSLPTTINR